MEGAQGRLKAIAAAEGITEEDIYRWAREVRAEPWTEARRIPRTLNNVRAVGYQCRGGGFGICARTGGYSGWERWPHLLITQWIDAEAARILAAKFHAPEVWPGVRSRFQAIISINGSP